MMDLDDVYEFVEEHDDEYLQFDKVENKLSDRADLHAFMLLDKLFPSNNNMLCDSVKGTVFLGVGIDDLLEIATEELLIELLRCGVCIEEDYLVIHA